MSASLTRTGLGGGSFDSQRGEASNSQGLIVVDDQAPMQELLKLYFEKQGFTVWVCETGAECLALLEKVQPDIVLLDIHLGKEDGMDVLTQIKNLRPTTKVVMHTGMGYPEDLLHEALNRGADGYVAKGIPLDEINRVIRQVVPEPAIKRDV